VQLIVLFFKSLLIFLVELVLQHTVEVFGLVNVALYRRQVFMTVNYLAFCTRAKCLTFEFVKAIVFLFAAEGQVVYVFTIYGIGVFVGDLAVRTRKANFLKDFLIGGFQFKFFASLNFQQTLCLSFLNLSFNPILPLCFTRQEPIPNIVWSLPIAGGHIVNIPGCLSKLPNFNTV